jgi:hypothetical protein
MTPFSQLRSWLRSAFRRSRLERDIDAELRFHLETYTDDLIRSGVPRDEAFRRAQLEFGGLERAKEECRDARGITLFESFFQDLRFGARTFCKSPAFTSVAILQKSKIESQVTSRWEFALADGPRRRSLQSHQRSRQDGGVKPPLQTQTQEPHEQRRRVGHPVETKTQAKNLAAPGDGGGEKHRA